MMRWIPAFGGAALAVLVILVPLAHRSTTSVEYRNLRVVTPGVLYRSGQLSRCGFDRVVAELGIGTVISLRDSVDAGGCLDDEWKRMRCRGAGRTFVRLPPPDWNDPTDGTVREFLRLLASPTTHRPVLLHCFAGIHRTGGLCAAYRVSIQGWSADDAIAEMQSIGTARTTFGEDLLRFVKRRESIHDGSADHTDFSGVR